MTPHVTAVMITGKHPDRVPLAMSAIRSFQQQTYSNRSLLIVRDNPDGASLTELLPSPDSRIKELVVDPGRSLGELRNYALDRLDTWVMQWDDDDWSHPDRMAQQMLCAQAEGRAVTLRRQIRYSFLTGSAYVAHTLRVRVGIAGTILHPPTTARYEAVGKHEDSRFAKALPGIYVMENAPQLYIRFHHGTSTWDAAHVMGRLAEQQQQWRLSQSAASYLTKVLEREYATPCKTRSPDPASRAHTR